MEYIVAPVIVLSNATPCAELRCAAMSPSYIRTHFKVLPVSQQKGLSDTESGQERGPVFWRP